MTQSHTLRPREKIAQFSAQKLSDHELLQAILGTGSRVATVKKLARSIEKLYRQNRYTLSYSLLRTVPGMGSAYASRIIAAFELTRRWQSPILLQSYPPLHEVLRTGNNNTVATVVCDLYNGAQELIDRLYIQVSPEEKPGAIIRSIMIHTLPTQATALQVGIVGDHSDRRHFFSDMLFGSSLKATLAYIDVSLKRLNVVDTDGEVFEVIL